MNSNHILFPLRAASNAAVEVLGHPSNRCLLSMHNGVPVLNVGHIRSKTETKGALHVATMGRAGELVDIALPESWAAVSKLQCAFQVATNGGIDFVDMSSNASSQAYGGQDGTQKLLLNGSKKASSSHNLCRIEIRVGKSDMAIFDIIWRFPMVKLAVAIEEWKVAVRPKHPTMADTILLPGPNHEPEDVVMTDVDTTPARINISEFVLETKALGNGAFGAVHRAVHPETNMALAVKVQNPKPFEQHLLQREIQIIKKLCHVSALISVSI